MPIFGQPIYHEDDKEGLRIFLHQPSAEAGKINAEQLGLQITDTMSWQTDETWVGKVINLMWAESSNPLRLVGITWMEKNLAGNLNASRWTALTQLYCDNNQLTSLNLTGTRHLKNYPVAIIY